MAKMGLSQRALQKALITVAGACYLIYMFSTFTHFQQSSRYLGNPISRLTERSRYRTSEDGLLQDVFNATLGFEKIFALNIPERTDHRDALILQSAVSEMKIEFINGVDGNSMSKKALPAGKHDGLGPKHLGAWRAHMNAISEVVRLNLSSALIFEDDIDWDVRVKFLLKDFATSVNVLQKKNGDQDFRSLPNDALVASSSPYGDDWDVLWPGHCGMKLSEESSRPDKVLHFDDETVPEKQHYSSFNGASPLIHYPHHTRVTVRTHEATCSLAYAVSNRGARKLLLNLGLQKLDGPFDNMISGWCEGSISRNCFGVIPPIFEHYRGAGDASRDSDIDNIEGNRDRSFSRNLRYSVRRNLERILDNDTDYEDQYPDA